MQKNSIKLPYFSRTFLVQCVTFSMPLGRPSTENGTHCTKKLLNTFKYHVSCTDGKISVRIIYFCYLFFNHCTTHELCFLSFRPFIVNVAFSTGLVVSSVSWLRQLAVDSWMSKPGDRRNYKTCWKCRINDKRTTGKKTQLVSGTTVEK